MKNVLLPCAAAAAALVVTLAPAAPVSAAPAAPHTPSPTAVAKKALATAVRKVDRYAAKHGVPADAKGVKLVSRKAPATVNFTYRAVPGSKPGYCASAAAPGMGGQRRWFHDSWTGKTWRTTAAAAANGNGACGTVADLPAADDGKAQLKTAVEDAWDVADAIDEYYYETEGVDALPTTVDEGFLASQGVTLTPGSRVVGYEVYDVDEDLYRFCVVRDSGAWASYDDDPEDIVGSGQSGAACTY